MAQPIITQVTLAQLNALIAGSATTWNNNYWGTQFYVTNKDWLLHAYKNNICKPVSGRLTIMNGNTLPTGIEPDVLLVDTGVITDDISDGFEWSIPINYYIKSMVLDIKTYNDSSVEFGGDFGSFSLTGEMTTNQMYFVKQDYYPLILPYTLINSVNGLGTENNNSIQAVIEFHKSPFA